MSEYLDFINSLGFSDSEVGNILAFLITIVIVIALLFLNSKVSSLMDGKINRIRKKLHLSKNRFALCFKFQIWVGYILGAALILYAAIEIFNIYPESVREIVDSSEMIQYTLTFLLIGFLFITIWEVINSVMEYGMYKNNRLSDSRMQTILPIFRNLILFILIIMLSLVILSELGIDIMPLLAGAGVVGIAIGFGAQTLVKDFLTGFTIILEDLLQIGDVVSVGDRVGAVEKITIRKIQLRSLEGTVHTVPFSEVSIIDNLTKDFSYYLMDIGVAYRENIDAVIECLESIDKQLREDQAFSDKILDPLEILGVDQFADSAVIIKARIKTKAHDKWLVGREFNRRMKIAFDDKDIEMPFPHQTLYFGEDKEGRSPAVNIKLSQQESSELETVDESDESKDSIQHSN